jgi:hypothetical protein
MLGLIIISKEKYAYYLEGFEKNGIMLVPTEWLLIPTLHQVTINLGKSI